MAKIAPPQDLALVKRKTPYQEWLDQEGIPVYRGYYIEDLRTLKLQPWTRMGCPGAYILLEGTDEQEDAYVLEIPPGKSSNSERHLYEEFIDVLQGRGATTGWNEGGGNKPSSGNPGAFSVRLSTLGISISMAAEANRLAS